MLSIAVWFLGTFGIKCNENHASKSIMLMIVFFTIWNIYVISVFRTERFMSVHKSKSIKEILKFSKQMALDNKKKEFEPDLM